MIVKPMDCFTALVTSDYTRAAAAGGQLASPDTHCIVLAAEQHPAPAVVVVGGDGAALPSEVLQTTLRGLQLAAAQHLGHLHTTCSPPGHHLAPGPLAHLDGEGAGGGGAGGPEHGGQLVALVAGVDIHVVARVGAADHRGRCRQWLDNINI